MIGTAKNELCEIKNKRFDDQMHELLNMKI